ncbi:MAG: SDR family oxidoreductase [Chloroflexi bacterium]|nr:SDR family oxidoreductase [Chloroflexota bacterium]MBM4453321.1 SDR family oxidoreductase [Chloroflexota bacterium]
MKDVEGKVVLITGGADGIGYALATNFVKGKAKVVLADIDEESLKKAASQLREMGGVVYPFECDVRDRAQVYDLAEQVHQQVGTVDILVNNAGVAFGGKFLDIPDEIHQQIMDVNIMGYIWVTKAFLADILAKKRGHLIFLASATGLGGTPKLSSYSTSKHAVVGFAETLRWELMMDKSFKDVHITIVCPAFVSTAMVEGVKPPRGTRLLTPQETGERIYKAMKSNKAMLIMPATVWLELLSKVFPPALSMWLIRFMKVDTCMDEWRGWESLYRTFKAKTNRR